MTEVGYAAPQPRSGWRWLSTLTLREPRDGAETGCQDHYYLAMESINAESKCQQFVAAWRYIVFKSPNVDPEEQKKMPFAPETTRLPSLHQDLPSWGTDVHANTCDAF